jgi:hypothetical protein
MIFSDVRSSSVVFLEELNKNDPPFYSHHAREHSGEITPVHFQMIDAGPHYSTNQIFQIEPLFDTFPI